MGTRADFYVGQDEEAEWLGSLAWDGYPDGISESGILAAGKEKEFRTLVEKYLRGRDDGTLPEMGWPWPWEDSRTTDFSYAFSEGKVSAAVYGHGWFDPLTQVDGEGEDPYETLPQVPFPNMAARKRVTFGSRSGLTMIGSAGLVDRHEIDEVETEARLIDQAVETTIDPGPLTRRSGLAETDPSG